MKTVEMLVENERKKNAQQYAERNATSNNTRNDELSDGGVLSTRRKKME
jgi:hypothetical protein